MNAFTTLGFGEALLTSQQFTGLNNAVKVKCEQLPTGTYFLHIIGEKSTIAIKRLLVR